MRNFAFACLIAALCTSAAIAETPVAYVYVSNNPNNSSTNELHAYTASADGKLTPIFGSPFADDLTSMAVNGKYLFGSNRNGIYVAAFAIASNGAPRWTRSTDIVQFNSRRCGSPGPLFLDHSGATLYDLEFSSDCANNSYQSLAVNKTTGSCGTWAATLTIVARPSGELHWEQCLRIFRRMSGDLYWEINGYKRGSTGALSRITITTPTPTPRSGDFCCPSQTAADPVNHVAITLQPVNNQEFTPDGPAKLATYTADNAGNLHTASTLANMPSAAVGTVTDLKMAPGGKLLAVAGSAGLQVFHFNGANPISAERACSPKANRPVVLGQRPSPLRHQPERGENLRLHRNRNQRQPGPRIALHPRGPAKHRGAAKDANVVARSRQSSAHFDKSLRCIPNDRFLEIATPSFGCAISEESNQVPALLRPRHMELHVVARNQRIRISKPLVERLVIPYDVRLLKRRRIIVFGTVPALFQRRPAAAAPRDPAPSHGIPCIVSRKHLCRASHRLLSMPVPSNRIRAAAFLRAPTASASPHLHL